MMWAAAAMSIFGAVSSYRGGKKQQALGREQAALAEKNAALAQEELDEGLRRQEAEDKRLQGKALARAAASGARLSGSAATSLEYLEEEQGRQLDWMKTAGASRIRLQLEGDLLRAKSTQEQGKTSAWSGLFSGLGSAFGFGNRAGMFGS